MRVHVAEPARSTDEVVALGFRPHTGWAAMVAAAGDSGHIRLLTRQRTNLLAESLPAQVFHAAAALPREEAEQLIGNVRIDACDAAVAVLEAATRIVGEPRGVGVVAWHPSIPAELDRILSSHQLIHAAEGDLYRRALHDAAAIVGVPIFDFVPAELPVAVATTLGRTPQSLREELTALGERVGPPWQRDQKDATLAAWSVLRLCTSLRSSGAGSAR